MSITASTTAGFIDPARLYTLRGFQSISGISRVRIYEAKKQGLQLPVFCVGRRKYIRGDAAIQFIERLASIGS